MLRAGIFTPEWEFALVKDGDGILFDRRKDPQQVNNLFEKKVAELEASLIGFDLSLLDAISWAFEQSESQLDATLEWLTMQENETALEWQMRLRGGRAMFRKTLEAFHTLEATLLRLASMLIIECYTPEEVTKIFQNIDCLLGIVDTNITMINQEIY